LAIAHKVGKRIGLNTSTTMTVNAVFAPDREYSGNRQPQPFRQADESQGGAGPKAISLQFISFASDRGPPIVTEVEIQASALRRLNGEAAEQWSKPAGSFPANVARLSSVSSASAS
jgi:hypothetical protein